MISRMDKDGDDMVEEDEFMAHFNQKLDEVTPQLHHHPTLTPNPVV